MSYSDLRYNEVRQTSSHNSFQRSEGIYDQVVYWRIRSLEIDLHLGKPFRDALKKDWYLCHVAGIDPDTTVDRFSGFLQICRGIQQAIPRHEVITVFLDIKDPFHRGASASQSAATSYWPRLPANLRYLISCRMERRRGSQWRNSMSRRPAHPRFGR